jgi:hypothetical protein
MLCDDKVKMREEREDREKNAKIGGLFSTVRFFFLLSLFWERRVVAQNKQ